MPNHQPPAFRFLSKIEGQDSLVEIGQVWKTSKPDVYSVSFDPEGAGEPIRCMMVPNRPKPAAVPAPTNGPTRNDPRLRRGAGGPQAG
jgi:hypothetical protein